jgi:hypothetical protein
MRAPRQKNIPASIRQRLLNYARCHDDNFQAVLTRYGRSASYIGFPNLIISISSFSRGPLFFLIGRESISDRQRTWISSHPAAVNLMSW